MSAQVIIKLTAEEFDHLRTLLKYGIEAAKIQANNAYHSGDKNEGWDMETRVTAGERLLSGPLS